MNLIYQECGEKKNMLSRSFSLPPSIFGLDRGLETPDFLLNQRLAFSELRLRDITITEI